MCKTRNLAKLVVRVCVCVCKRELENGGNKDPLPQQQDSGTTRNSRSTPYDMWVIVERYIGKIPKKKKSTVYIKRMARFRWEAGSGVVLKGGVWRTEILKMCTVHDSWSLFPNVSARYSKLGTHGKTLRWSNEFKRKHECHKLRRFLYTLTTTWWWGFQFISVSLSLSHTHTKPFLFNFFSALECCRSF